MSRFSDWSTGKKAKQRITVYAAAVGKKRRAVQGDIEWAEEAGWLYRASSNNGEGVPDEFWLTVPECGHGHEWDDIFERSEALEAEERKRKR
ncbi:hypothetical protein [Streptomyces endophytica]|uniref:Uncharacterized protein n=1 Tax=Streptomyces endophytica TaxID=2991496 RepID=A0ABY6P6E3_9ACTN|nr:hypothetical protein [Streptomyces endophytica]UZJ29361.1 hypothetical protein OJ254_01210 [Streptomyces endophytica]